VIGYVVTATEVVFAGKVDEGDETVLVGVVIEELESGTEVVAGSVEVFDRDANPPAIPPPMAAARTTTRTTIKIQNVLGLRPATVRRASTP